MNSAALGVHLNSAQRSTLTALARTVLPHLFEAESDTYGIVQRIEDRVLRAPRHVTEDLFQAISFFGSRTGGLLVTGLPRRFARLSAAGQNRVFAAWGNSALPIARTVHQALRRLILTTWYATDEGHAELGVHPPLHTRAPMVAWEGPLKADRASNLGVVATAVARNDLVPRSSPAPRPIPQGVTTAESFSRDLALTADVVIVGSGAGGAVAAARFAEAGREVVILEQGEFLRSTDFNEHEGEMVPRLFAEQAMRTTTDASISLLQGSTVGGGSTVNWMLMLRPPDHVLDEWARAFHLDGLGVGDLGPHLDRIGDDVHAGFVPEDAHAPSNRAILRGAQALGWHARPAMINARGCVRAGTCSLGCRYDAKQSVLLTYLPRALNAGARLFAGASVEGIDILERDHPSRSRTPPRKQVRAVVRDRGGAVRGRLTVDAPIVVLAAGAVGTPVLLQRSGLGGGGVGRFLRLHPTTGVMGRYDDETYPIAGIPQTALCDEFVRRDGDGYGFWIECPALLPAIASAALQGFGAEHRDLMRQLRHTVAFIVLVRDGSGSEASMGSVRLDARGRVRIRHRMTAADRENLRRGIEASARLHLAAGARDVISLHTPIVRATTESELHAIRSASVAPNRVALFSAHVNGTCRLGADPANSGCTPTGERHGVRGLYVMDGSLMPTAPGVNPQWTIMALASLLSERAVI
jgi:choline dehydrogenase-like flavoprotein